MSIGNYNHSKFLWDQIGLGDWSYRVEMLYQIDIPPEGSQYDVDELVNQNFENLPTEIKDKFSDKYIYMPKRVTFKPRSNRNSDHVLSLVDALHLVEGQQQLFTIEDADAVAKRIQESINAPYVTAYSTALGGAEHVSIMFTISLDDPSTWPNHILHNSRFFHFNLKNNGKLENFTRQYWIKTRFRARTEKTIDKVIQDVNAYLQTVLQESGGNTMTSIYRTADFTSSEGESVYRKLLDVLLKSEELDDRAIESLKNKIEKVKDREDKRKLMNIIVEETGEPWAAHAQEDNDIERWFTALLHNDYKTVKEMIDAGFDIRTPRPGSGMTALQMVQNGGNEKWHYIESLLLAVEHGGYIPRIKRNSKDISLLEALHIVEGQESQFKEGYKVRVIKDIWDHAGKVSAKNEIGIIKDMPVRSGGLIIVKLDSGPYKYQYISVYPDEIEKAQ